MTHLPQKEDVLAALTGRHLDFYQSHTLLKRVGHEWRGSCPLHHGKDANFAVNPDTGHWFCHSQCQEGGDILDFVRKQQGFDFPAALAHVAEWAGVHHPPPIVHFVPAPTPDPAKFLDPGLAERAHAALMDNAAVRLWLSEHRGLATETLQRFQIGLLPAETPGGPYRIAFPVYDSENRLTNIRRHLFAYQDGLDRTYKTLPWEKGLRSDLFPLSSLEERGDVLLVEGEADAVLACQMGFSAVTGTLGAGNWKPEWTDALRGRSVTLLYDNDAAGQDGAAKVAAALAAAGCSVRLASLPNGKGNDLTEWIQRHGGTAADLQAVLAAAVPVTAPARAPALPRTPARKTIAERVVDLADVGPPGALPLLFGPYLLQGHAHWMTGQTGLGKSTLLFNIATALAEGTPLWGLDCDRTRVLYADMESGDVGRSHKIDRLYGSSPRVRGQLFFLREPVKLPEEMEALLHYVSEMGIEFVIFDTARRCFSVRDENDNAEVYNRVIPTLDALKQRGVGSLTLGHPSKNGNGSARGAGAQEDAGDVNLSLTLHQGQITDTDAVIALRVTKNRLLGLGVPPLFLKRVGDDQFEPVEAGALPELPREAPGKRELCRAALLEHLGSLTTGHSSYGDLIAAMKQQGYTEATARRAKDDLEKDGEIVRAVGGGYCLPDPFAE